MRRGKPQRGHRGGRPSRPSHACAPMPSRRAAAGQVGSRSRALMGVVSALRAAPGQKAARGGCVCVRSEPLKRALSTPATSADPGGMRLQRSACRSVPRSLRVSRTRVRRRGARVRVDGTAAWALAAVPPPHLRAWARACCAASQARGSVTAPPAATQRGGRRVRCGDRRPNHRRLGQLSCSSAVE